MESETEKRKKKIDFRVWKQSQNLKNEGIMIRAAASQNEIRNFTEELNEEENYQYKKKAKKDTGEDKSKGDSEKHQLLSEKCQSIVNDVNKTIANINAATNEIKQLNSLYLINTTKKINKENTQESDNTNNDKNRSLTLPLIKSSKGKNLSMSMRFVNESYRRQLNKAFMNFNPTIHLANLNMLRKADPEINKDIEALEKHIDDDLNEITSPNYYRNNYEKLKAMKKPIMHTTVPTSETEGSSNEKPKKYYFQFFRKKYKLKPSEIKKKFPDREIEEKTLDFMQNAVNKMKNTVNNENIGKYIDDYEHLSTLDIKRQRHLYFSGLYLCGDILKEIQHEKIVRDLNERTIKKKKILTEENRSLIKNIELSKASLLNEIAEEEAK